MKIDGLSANVYCLISLQLELSLDDGDIATGVTNFYDLLPENESE